MKKDIKLENGIELSSLPVGQQHAIKNAYQLTRKLLDKDAVNSITLMKLELLYSRIEDARQQLRMLADNPKAVATGFDRLFRQLHRLLDGAEDKCFHTFSWENSYRTERDLARLESRLFVFRQVIFWISQEIA